MKDLLTTAASIIIILFCFSLLFLGDETGANSEEPIPGSNINHDADVQSEKKPSAKSTLFKRVQSVDVENGVLMFVTREQEYLKEHYFQIRDKNVVLIKNINSDMPHDSIKFEDNGHNTMLVTIPDTFGIDYLKVLSIN